MVFSQSIHYRFSITIATTIRRRRHQQSNCHAHHQRMATTTIIRFFLPSFCTPSSDFKL
jgi:hypothetical protein